MDLTSRTEASFKIPDYTDGAPSTLGNNNDAEMEEILKSASNSDTSPSTQDILKAASTKLKEQPNSLPYVLRRNTPEDIFKFASNAVRKNERPYENINSRCATFKDWPLHHFIKPIDLAKAGFYYTGFSDTVQCYECEIRLKNFELDDIPMLEHCRWSPKCSLVRSFFKYHLSL